MTSWGARELGGPCRALSSSGLVSDMSEPQPLIPVNGTLVANISKLKISREIILHLEWANDQGPGKRKEREMSPRHTGRKPCEDRGGDWSASRGMPRRLQPQEPGERPGVKSQSPRQEPTCDFRLPASRTVAEQSSVVSSFLLTGGDLLWQP